MTRSTWVRRGLALAAAIVAVVVLGATEVSAVVQKAQTPLDQKTRIYSPFHQFPGGSSLAEIEGMIPNAADWQAFLGTVGPQNVYIDPVTGRIVGVAGSGIPWIPGLGNSLTLSDITRYMDGPTATPGIPELEKIAREFVDQHASLFRISKEMSLQLNSVSSTATSKSTWSVWFDLTWNGLPVQGAYVNFVVKHGNLVLWGTKGVDDISLPVSPNVGADQAKSLVGKYIGGFLPGVDTFGKDPVRVVVPERIDRTHGYRQVWEVRFHREKEGNYLARVDAYTGEILEFRDENDYAQIKGGIYPLTNTAGTEVSRNFSFADYGAALYADSGGVFTYVSGTVTSTLNGKYVVISDKCGAISLSTSAAPGDLDFGSSAGTDCTTPGVGGVGNTHSARSCYYHTDGIKQKGRTYLPANAWLQAKITANVDINNTCNAYWNGSTVNFYRSGGGCANTGEIAAIFLHEWGHGMDSNDGNGAQGSGEAMGDTVAMLQLRSSCIGPNFLASQCGGYGNACTACTGVRDQDRAKHATNEILTPANIATRCTSAGTDPCGREVHCEGMLPGNTVWDLTNDLPAGGYGLGTEDVWQLVDKLWWESGPTRTAGNTCTNKTGAPWNNGCASTTWYQTFLTADDDDGNLANGTPHAATLFTSFNRHGISCGIATDAANTNHTTCPAIGSVGTPTAIGSNNTVALSWNHATNAATYRILRNNLGCSFGFTQVGTATDTGSGTQSFNDTSAANGTTWYYVIQPVGTNVDCVGTSSSCVSATPSPCTTPGTPTIGTATTPASNQIRITWTAGAPAGATYNIYRVMGAPACPGSGFTLLATGVAASPYNDNTVSGGSTYSYKVTAVDGTGGCESAQSGCVSAVATGACTAPPSFAGLTTVANPGNAVCTLNLSWSAATPVCAGPATYNVYRSTTAPFTPAAGNRIATGVTTTTYSDATGLVSGTTYYYIVRAVDSSNASEETNTVTKSAKVTGPITTSTLTETFEGALSGGGFDLAGWTHGFLSGTVDWVWSTAQAQTPTHSWFSADQTTTSDRVLTSPSFGIGASTTLSFYHTYAFEGSTATCYDAGTLEISTDGGTNWTVVPDAAFTAGLFTGTVNTGFSNPIGGKRAWCGGTIGAMTQVTVNLGGTYSGQANSKLRWHEGDDSSATGTGWYVDSVTIANAQTAGSCTTGSGCTAPGAPTLTGATGSCGGSGVVLTWTAGTGSTASYNVYRSSNTSCPVGTLTKIAGPIATLTYTDTTAVAGTTYTYVVRGACDAGGSSESPNSNCLAGTLPVVPAAPAAPGVADIDACAASGVSITWSTVSGATGYDLQVDGGAITVGVTSPYTYVPVDANSHTYAIRGKNASCTGAFSTTTAGTDVNSAPPSITGVMMWNRASDLFITWTQVANPALVDYYEVMRASAPAGPFSTSVGTTTGIVHGMTLDLTTEPANSYYKVRAVKGSCPGPLAP